MIGKEFQGYSYTEILAKALSRVPDTIDKRVGSIIYDAIAPACYVLAEAYFNMQNIVNENYILTASGDYLEYRTMELGVQRKGATAAIRRGVFRGAEETPMSIPIGSRFSANTNTLNYKVINTFKDSGGTPIAGQYQLEAETLGSIGNDYMGNLIPITYINGLESAFVDNIIISGTDTEDDEQLRGRYLELINAKSFGGNISDYKQWMRDIDGVGAVQIYPIWNGGGTVKISVVDGEYNPISPAFVTILQDMIDPVVQGNGQGIAPIGHLVTIVSPTQLVIDIETNVTLQAGYNINQVKDSIEQAVTSYINEIRASWGVETLAGGYETIIYISRVNSAILSVAGVVNVTGTTINGQPSDVETIQNATTQQVPTIGSVDIS